MIILTICTQYTIFISNYAVCIPALTVTSTLWHRICDQYFLVRKSRIGTVNYIKYSVLSYAMDMLYIVTKTYALSWFNFSYYRYLQNSIANIFKISYRWMYYHFYDQPYNNNNFRIYNILCSYYITQLSIYYYCSSGQLSTTCINDTEWPNGQLLVALDHSQPRIMASETVDPIDCRYPYLYKAVLPESHLHGANVLYKSRV